MDETDTHMDGQIDYLRGRVGEDLITKIQYCTVFNILIPMTITNQHKYIRGTINRFQ